MTLKADQLISSIKLANAPLQRAMTQGNATMSATGGFDISLHGTEHPTTDAGKVVQAMIFDSWTGLGRVLLVGALAYVSLIILLRISGKRTLTKLNAFDLVITVALGSALATVLLTKSVSRPVDTGLILGRPKV